MPLINWTNDFSVNVAEIDQQHKKLVGMINELHDAMRAGKGKDIIGSIINNLIDYARVHFGTEEKYFAQFGYPETEVHKMEHAGFIKKTLDFNNGFKQGKIGLTIEVMNFLSDWLKNHILKTDKRYSKFFNEHGLK